MPLSPPQPLADGHDLTAFTSGVGSLDEWLRRRARANQVSGASRTFVVAENGRVVAYYALASGVLAIEGAPGGFRRNMPDPIPIALLARLAIDIKFQGQGLGRSLFRDCCQRVVHAADTLGIRGIVTHAISEQAKAFYLAVGLEPSSLDPMTLMVTLADVRAVMQAE